MRADLIKKKLQKTRNVLHEGYQTSLTPADSALSMSSVAR